MNHPLLEKLETYYIRFKEIGQLITDPEVIQDMERYVRLTKEYKELETITRTADKFKAALLSVEESKDILLHEEDKELREMAEMEIEELEDKLPGMEQELKLLLVPADPDDSRSGEEREEMKPVCLPATCSGCMRNFVSVRGGKSR